jgi:hypothetical protein
VDGDGEEGDAVDASVEGAGVAAAEAVPVEAPCPATGEEPAVESAPVAAPAESPCPAIGEAGVGAETPRRCPVMMQLVGSGV